MVGSCCHGREVLTGEPRGVRTILGKSCSGGEVLKGEHRGILTMLGRSCSGGEVLTGGGRSIRTILGRRCHSASAQRGTAARLAPPAVRLHARRPPLRPIWCQKAARSNPFIRSPFKSSWRQHMKYTNPSCGRLSSGIPNATLTPTPTPTLTLTLAITLTLTLILSLTLTPTLR